MTNFIHTLDTRFSLKDLGPLSYFLGVEVQPIAKGIFLSQWKYTIDLLTRANMLDAKPVSTPMDANITLTLGSGSSIENATEYRTLVGSLQ